MRPRQSVEILIANTTMHSVKRKTAGLFFVHNPNLIPELLQIAAHGINRDQILAFAILDEIGETGIIFLKEHAENLFKLFLKAKDQTSIRCSSRIAMHILKQTQLDREFIPGTLFEKYCELCFDWLIGNNKVATKVNAIYGLSAAANLKPEIYEMLVSVIEKDFASGSPGFKVAIRNVVSKRNHLPKN